MSKKIDHKGLTLWPSNPKTKKRASLLVFHTELNVREHFLVVSRFNPAKFFAQSDVKCCILHYKETDFELLRDHSSM